MDQKREHQLKRDEEKLARWFEQYEVEVTRDVPDFDSMWLQAKLEREKARGKWLSWMAVAASILLLLAVLPWWKSKDQTNLSHLSFYGWTEPTRILLTESYQNMVPQADQYSTDFLLEYADELVLQNTTK